MRCQKCELYKTRKNIVLGSGSISSRIIFIGEAPGFHEDRVGKPFVGKAGKIFDNMLSTINLNRNQIYLTNIVKCRPPKNRNPTDEEISTCSKYLDIEIRNIQPKIIIPMGKFATQYILQKNDINFESMFKSRGVSIKTRDYIIYPIYHPAALIYNNDLKSVMKDDMKRIKEIIEGDKK